VIKIWGRNTSVNVQKVMWAVGELKLAHERIDVGGTFGKNREAAYLAMNPNGLVPTLQEDDFILWESNSIVRYLAAKHGAGALEPSDLRARARAGSWMDWQLSVAAPAIHGLFWGMVRTPPEKRDHAASEASREKTAAALKVLDAQLAKTRFVVGETLSMGDIPVALMAYRFSRLAPERTGLDNVQRWFREIEMRPAFKEHVLAIPFV
jgi:glutathione S-transferase